MFAFIDVFFNRDEQILTVCRLLDELSFFHTKIVIFSCAMFSYILCPYRPIGIYSNTNTYHGNG